MFDYLRVPQQLLSLSRFTSSTLGSVNSTLSKAEPVCDSQVGYSPVCIVPMCFGEDFLKLLLLLPSFRVDTDRHRYCLGSNSMQILDALSLLACCRTIQVEPTCSAQCPQVQDNCCTHTSFMEYFFTCSAFLTLLSSVDNPSTQLFSFFLISGLRSLPLHQSFRVQVCLQRYKTRTKKKVFQSNY